jgi:predicted RND superfamily exporter protein
MELFGIIMTVLLALLVLAAWLIPQYQQRRQGEQEKE